MDKKTEIFCSYAHEDRAMLEQLEKHLKTLQRQGKITVWSNADISPGMDQKEELHKHLESSDIILLLISPDFMASDICDTEMEHAIERYKQKKAQVIPILLKAADLKGTPIEHLKPLPKSSIPISSEKNPNDAFFNVAQEIGYLVDRLNSPDSPSHHKSEPMFDRDLKEHSQIFQIPTHFNPTREKIPITKSISPAKRTLIYLFPTTIFIIVIVLSFFLIPQIRGTIEHGAASNQSTPPTTSTQPDSTAAIAKPNPTLPAIYSVPANWSLRYIGEFPQTDHETTDWASQDATCQVSPAGHAGYYEETGINSDNCNDGSYTFTDLAFVVQMTIIQGKQAGIIFLKQKENYYAFDITIDGTYILTKHSDSDSGGSTPLLEKPSKAIRQGSNQKNTLGVVVKNHSFQLFINDQPVDSISDKTNESGTIGTGIDASQDGLTTALFKDAQLWLPPA